MKKNKKKYLTCILYEIFHCLTFFFIGGGISSLVLAVCTGDPITTYGYVCCYGAFPATCFRALFQWLDKKEEWYIVKDEVKEQNENN